MPFARLVSFGLIVAAVLQAGCDHGGDDTAPAGTLVALVRSRAETSTTATALLQTPLQGALRSGEYTLFAPSDLAWAQLGPETVEAYLQGSNAAILEEVLGRHVVPRTVTAAELVDGATFQPLEGPPLIVDVDAEGGVYVSGAEVVTSDLGATNGLVHVVDRVVRDHLALDERLRVIPLLSTLTTGFTNAALTSLLAGTDEPVTLFAPFNSAFDGLFPETTARLLAPSNRPVLERVLRHHIVRGRIHAEDLQDGQELQTLEGDVLRVRREGRLVYVGDARLAVADVETASGTLHIVDEVLRDNLRVLERIRLSPTLAWLDQALGRVGAPPVPPPFTLFAPSAEGISRLNPGVLDALLSDVPLLERVTRYAFVPGLYREVDLVPGLTLETTEGTPVTLTEDPRNGAVRFDEGTLQTADIVAADGVIHLVDGLVRPPLSVWEQLLFSDLLAFREAVRSTQLRDRLHGSAPVTVFGPGSGVFGPLLQSTNPSQLSRLVRAHMVGGAYGPEDLQSGLELQTLYPDSTLKFVGSGTSWSADGIPVAGPVEATNGLVWTAEGLLAVPSGG